VAVQTFSSGILKHAHANLLKSKVQETPLGRIKSFGLILSCELMLTLIYAKSLIRIRNLSLHSLESERQGLQALLYDARSLPNSKVTQKRKTMISSTLHQRKTQNQFSHQTPLHPNGNASATRNTPCRSTRTNYLSLPPQHFHLPSTHLDSVAELLNNFHHSRRMSKFKDFFAVLYIFIELYFYAISPSLSSCIDSTSQCCKRLQSTYTHNSYPSVLVFAYDNVVCKVIHLCLCPVRTVACK
jgi:hypothetical protein